LSLSFGLNHGIVGFQRILSILNFIIKTNFTIYPILQYPKTRYFIFPIFQHSIISIALDGYVKGPPRFFIQGPYANFNHHEGVARIATRSTCAQVYFYICLGLLDTFQKRGEPHANVYINDCIEMERNI